MKYTDLFCNNKIEFVFEIMMLKVLTDLVPEPIDMEGVTVEKIHCNGDLNLINNIDFKKLLNHNLSTNLRFKTTPYVSASDIAKARFEEFPDRSTYSSEAAYRADYNESHGYMLRVSQNNLNAGLSIENQKLLAGYIVGLLLMYYQKTGKSLLEDPKFSIMLLIDKTDFDESKIEELAYMAMYSDFWKDRIQIVVDDIPGYCDKLKKLMRANFYIKNQVPNIIKNKIERLNKIPIDTPMVLATIKGRMDSTFKEEQIVIYKGFDAKKQSIILDKYPLYLNTKAYYEYTMDNEGITSPSLRAEAKQNAKPLREYFSIYTTGVLCAYKDEEKILIPIDINDVAHLITYGTSTYYNVPDEDEVIPYGEFIKYVLADHGIEYNKEGFERYYYSEGCTKLWI